MSIKIQQTLIECLNKIESKNFDEDTIRTLLITSREYLTKEGLIKELAHFIAHPERNRGIFHSRVNSRYAKFKLINEQVSKIDFSKIQENIKNEKELGDFLLGGIEIEKIDAQIFEILYKKGLEDLSEELLIKNTGLTKKEIEKFLNEIYTKKK